MFFETEPSQAFIAPKASESLLNDFEMAANFAGWKGNLRFQLYENFPLR